VDLVLLRNVLIYFDVETKRRILDRVLGVLPPDGCLVLGGSETTLGIHDGFDRTRIDGGVYYRPRGRETSAA
jgi:chemotaxis protein methyltransferase CheR